MERKKMGRPPKKGEPRSEQFNLRMTPQERAKLEENAAKKGLSLTEFLLWAALFGVAALIIDEASKPNKR